jgi:high affinity Mn2+ porin
MDVHACFNPKKVRRWSVFTRRGGVPSEVRDNLRGEVRARPSRVNVERLACASSVAAACVLMISDAFAADLSAPVAKAAPVAQAYDWTGFYVGGNVGLATGNSNWTANAATPGVPPVSGSLSMYQSPNAFYESGSWLIGVQGGYNYMLRDRVVLGAEVDATFPTFRDLSGLSTGGITRFTSPTPGAVTYGETMLSSGTVRARIGYAPGNWLFYATGGFAWTYDSQDLAQLGPGIDEPRLLWRLGWAAGAGVDVPIAPHWTVKGEFLWTGFPAQTVSHPLSGQRIASDLSLEQFRLGLNYRFDDPSRPAQFAPSRFVAAMDIFAVHGQATFVDQDYPSFRSPYEGINSLSGGGQNRETFDLTLSTGVKLWQGAEFWVNPEIDQGFGFDDTHGVAGFPSAESYKLGSAYPYARLQRAFMRQTIDLGDDTEKVNDDFYQFAGTRSTDRLVLTVGRFSIVDIFDTNKYANNPKVDFLNWSLINAGTFDYAGDGWGYSYGAAAEWYTGRWTLRAGVFDLSNTPAGGVSPTAYALDPTFQQFEVVGEIEERHDLWGEPGKIKMTGFLSRGRAGNFNDAVALAQATGMSADINAVRSSTSRPGVSLNIEQQVNESLGVFFRAGWADGDIEPWDFTDIDRTVSGGVSINGRNWGRPDDTVGIAGVANNISGVHQAYFNAGGLGILIGDGQLPNPGLEKIFETYYSYALAPDMRLSFDYQFIANPAYNTDRGPVNTFAARFHAQF